MQLFDDTHVEIRSKFFVWSYRGMEIEAFRTQSAVEAAIRRQFQGGWTTDYIFDSNGDFLFLGLKTDHSYTVETRDAITGV